MGRSEAIAAQLALPPEDLTFSEELVAGQPEPVRRFFTHAIAPGTPLARSVRLEQTGSMKPSPSGSRFEIIADGNPCPTVRARLASQDQDGTASVPDCRHPLRRQGPSLRGTVLGIPVLRASGIDVSRSSRHRVVAESLWVPSALLPHRGVVWTAETDADDSRPPGDRR